jgi:transcriptional regulator with XRE-family HTH domain
MTPFGEKIRNLRQKKSVSQAAMAEALGISPAYLSALEHGKKGKPSWSLVQAIITYFEVIWDEAEELQNLAKVSHPRVTIDTSGLSPKATMLANYIARDVSKLSEKKIEEILEVVLKAPIK